MFVCVDDYSRYTWVDFVREKSDTFGVFTKLCLQVQREKGGTIGKIVRLRSDHGKEFENSMFADFCNSEGIAHEFSAPITPQQNGIVERKNRTLQEMARVMMLAQNIPTYFWAEALNTACHIHNRVTLRPGMSLTLYEIWRGRKPNVKYFRVFGSTCYILADREPRRKLDARSDEGIFLGYSRNSRAYRVFNKGTKTMMESINVVINDDESEVTETVTDDDEAPVTANVRATVKPSVTREGPATVNTEVRDTVNTSLGAEETHESNRKAPSRRVQLNHPATDIIGALEEGVRTRSKTPSNLQEEIGNVCFVSKIEPKNVNEAVNDEYWCTAMQEELIQFEKNQVWELVPKPSNVNIIGTK